MGISLCDTLSPACVQWDRVIITQYADVECKCCGAATSTGWPYLTANTSHLHWATQFPFWQGASYLQNKRTLMGPSEQICVQSVMDISEEDDHQQSTLRLWGCRAILS